MNIEEYKARVRDYLMTRPMTLEIANNIAEMVLDASESVGEIDCEAIETSVFGKRVECPKCGSLVLPEFECWGCEEWTAPKSTPREG